MITWEEAVCVLRDDPSKADLVAWCYYDDPLIEAAGRFHASEEWREVKRLIGNKFPCRVLELGAGRGITSFAFARDGCDVTALEPDPSPIVGAGAIRDLANLGKLEIKVVEQWGESLPFDDASFDLVYGRAVFHHAQDLPQFCKEAFRVLKPGGQFLITREHVLSKPEDLRTFLEGHPLHSLYGGEAAYMLQDYLSALRKSGFNLKHVLGPHSSMINFYPATNERRTQVLLNAFSPRIPRRIASLLLTIHGVGRWAANRIDSTNQQAGRLYSFLASRP